MNRFLPILFTLFFVFLYFLITLLPYNPITFPAHAQTITIGATVDEHLTWRRDGDNLIISTNKSEGFTLIIVVEADPSNARQKNNIKVISKKGPIILTLLSPSNFILTSGF